MKKNQSLIIILILTIPVLGIILFLSMNTRYNKLIVDENTISNIKSNKSINNNIKIENISFNDYNLLIDETNKTVYYSIVSKKDEYNPLVDYKTSDNCKLVVNKELEHANVEDKDIYKIIIYNDKNYKEYSLCITEFPILNINMDEKNNISEKNNMKVDIYIFDNHIDSPKRVVKSYGKIKKENDNYYLLFKQESLGHNRRDNPISIFGMDMHDEYILEKESSTTERNKFIRLFINDEYQGIYSIKPNIR